MKVKLRFFFSIVCFLFISTWGVASEANSEELVIKKIECLNSVETFIEFSEKLDQHETLKAEVITFSTGHKIKELKFVGDNGIKLYHEPITTNNNVTLIIKNIIDIKGRTLLRTVSKRLEYKDFQKPKIIGIEIEGERSVIVILSEPVMRYKELYDKKSYTLRDSKNKKIGIKSIVSLNSRMTKVKFVLAKKLSDLKNERLTLKIDEVVTDYSGNRLYPLVTFLVNTKKTSQEIIESKVDFEVISVEPLNLVETRIIFTNKLKTSIIDPQNFALVQADNKPIKSIRIEDEQTIVVTHSPIINGEKALITVKNIRNKYGNKVKSYSERLQYLDIKIPMLLSGEYINNNVVRLTFSEAMRNDKGEYNKEAFKVSNNQKEDIIVTKAMAVDGDNRKVDLYIESRLLKGEYSIKVNSLLLDEAGFGINDQIVISVD